jgi:putative ABC transport system permease protein
MILKNALLLALRAIQRNLMRSILTSLGIVIGVASVIVMVNLGNSATAQISQDIASLGSNLLMVIPAGQSIDDFKLFNIDDVEAIRREVRGISSVAPSASKGMTAILGNRNRSTQVTGIDNSYFQAGNWQLTKGREFSISELRAGSAVCILGGGIHKELFGAQEPLGEMVRINKLSCRVIGLLKSRGQSSNGGDQDNQILMPLRTFWRRIAGNQSVEMITISGQDGFSTAKIQKDIEQLLRERRHIDATEENNFAVQDMKEIAETMVGITQLLTTLLGTVAAVSLLVGGIGIMNIMLVSVTERTREIGIRLAIGAQRHDVLLQFLVEAVVLSSLGGAIGIVLALLTSFALTSLLNMPLVLNPGIILLAFLFSAMVGVIFGYFPARKAAIKDPIEALRFE